MEIFDIYLRFKLECEWTEMKRRRIHRRNLKEPWLSSQEVEKFDAESHTYIHTYTHTCKHTYIYIYIYIYIYTFSFHQKVSLLVRIEKVYIFNIHLEICNVFENSYVYIFVSKMVANCDDVDCVNVAICSTLV